MRASIDLYSGRQFYNVEWQNPAGLQYQITMAQMAGDVARQRRLTTLIETAEGHYDCATPAYLNSAFPDVQPMTFQQWFLSTFQCRSILLEQR
jgi:hypothetical protein